jgi:hypothetical protein
MVQAKHNLPYDIVIIDSDGKVGIAVELDDGDDATAINWAYYYLGKYRGDKAQIWRGHTNPRDHSTFVMEISSAGDARRRPVHYPVIELLETLERSHECIKSRMADLAELADCDQAYMVQTEHEIRTIIELHRQAAYMTRSGS